MNRHGIFRSVIVACALILAYWTHTSSSFSEICVRCLQRVSGRELRVLGVKIHRSRTMNRSSGGIMDPATLGSGVPPVDPAFFEELMGSRCVHVFVLQGKCVHSLNLVKCYAGSGQYRSRIETLEELYGLYRRVPNKSLARRTYERINGARSTDATSDGADLYLLKEHLALVTNEEDWNYV